MPEAYPAAELDPILSDLLGALDANVTAVKTASEQLAEIRQQLEAERQKSAQLEKQLKTATKQPAEDIVLRKVASFDGQKIDQVVNYLVEQQIIKTPEDGVKLASELRRNPEMALDLVTRIASFHESPAPAMGAGVNKQANELTTSDPDTTFKGATLVDSEGWGDWFAQVKNGS